MTVAVVFSESPEGAEALRVAGQEAKLRDDTLAVLYVDDSDDPVSEQSALTVRSRIEELFSDAETPPEVHTASRGRSVAGAIVDLAAEVGATLLVIGSRQRTATGKFLLGSTVQRVLLDSPIPVLTVKAQDE